MLTSIQNVLFTFNPFCLNTLIEYIDCVVLESIEFETPQPHRLYFLNYLCDV